MPSGLDWADWADLIPRTQALWANEAIRPGLLFLGLAALVYFIPTGSKRDRQMSQQRARDDDEDVKRPTNTAWPRRLWWRIRPPTDLMRVDGLVIDRTRKPHCAWLGPTGAGKSASVATVRVDGARPTLCAMPDLSDPIREAALRLDGFIWTAGVSTVAVDFLIGSPTEVAERLTEVFRSGGVGAWKRAARRATADVIRVLDASGQPRTLQMIGELLHQSVKSDRNLSTVCAGWVDRFLDLADQFGPSIGAGGVDLAELLRQSKTVVLDNDAFSRPSLGGDVVALALAEAKRCATLVPGGFRLIFEEAGQLGERIDLAEPFHRAGRRRKIMVDDLTQAESDLVFHGNDGITANLATRVYFAQELKSLQKVAADRLGLDYRELDPAKMHDFTAWIAHGKIRRLVHFPKPPTFKSSSYDSCPIPTQTDTPAPRRTIVREIPPPPDGLPSLPPPRLEVQAILDQIDRSGHCHLWTGAVDKDGYGIARWNKNNRGVHRIVWELAYGPIGKDATGKSLEIDHQCRVRRCVRLDHLELVTKGENSRRRWRVRGVGAAAD